MGKYIQVDLVEMSHTIAKLESYIAQRKGLVQKMNSEISALSAQWSGEDLRELQTQWDGMKAPDGVMTLSEKQLESYHDFLSAARSAYQKAQLTSAEQAEKIGNWF